MALEYIDNDQRRNKRRTPKSKNDIIKEIRAIHNDTIVRVYQAYNDDIADAAISAQSFRGPLDAGLWSATRMTWIKPSKVWMAYRCGYTVLKDKNQARVLALDISRRAFEELLLQGQLSNHSNNSKDDDKKRKCRDCNVVIQWDPERQMAINNELPKNKVYTTVIPSTRSIQIGLRDKAVEMLLDPNVVLRITDVTNDFRNALEALKVEKNLEKAQMMLWPNDGENESLMEIPENIRVHLGMNTNIIMSNSSDVQETEKKGDDASEECCESTPHQE